MQYLNKKRTFIKKKGIFFLVLSFIFLSCGKKEKESQLDSSPIILSKDSIPALDRNFIQVDNLDKLDLETDYKIEIKKEKTKFFFESDNLEMINDVHVDKNGVVSQPDGSYFPTAIAQMGMRAINRYHNTGSEEAKQVLLNQAKWAKDNFEDHGNYGFWVFTQPQPAYHIDKPWTSAMGQGEMLSLCLAGYEITQDKTYLEIIQKGLKGFLIPIEDGGFLRNWNSDEAWFEEYATSRPSRVLNGAIFGLAGVFQVYEATGSQLALQIFNAGIATVKNHLENYNAGYTSRYNLADWKNEVVKEHYHEIHILQMLWLYRITKDPIFKKYAKIFLENDKGDVFRFIKGYKIKSKIDEIIASNCIDCEKHGPKNLTDGLWAYGDFWSSYQNSELIIDFGDVKEDFYAITLFHVNKVSSEIDFDLYAFNENTKKWDLKQRFLTKEIKDRVSGYNITSDYETFIEHYKIFESVSTSKIKLVFHTDSAHVIAFREINFMYNRDKDIDYILETVDKKITNIYE